MAMGRGAGIRTLVCSELQCGLRKLTPVSFLLAMLCLHLATDGTQNAGAAGAAGCRWGRSISQTTIASTHSSVLLGCFFCFLALSQFLSH